MIFLEASYSASESLDGLGMPRPSCKSSSESEDLFVLIIDSRFPGYRWEEAQSDSVFKWLEDVRYLWGHPS